MKFMLITAGLVEQKISQQNVQFTTKRLSGINCLVKHIPGVLYHVQIWRTRRHVLSYDVVGLFVDCDVSAQG